MVDSVGGPVKVNNFLSTLNVPTVSNKNLKVMETRAGEVIEHISKMSSSQAAQEVYKEEME